MSISTASRVVILGGTSGIGLATAKAAAAVGASVVVASRNPASVKSALSELPAGSAGRAVDASSTEELAAFFEFAGDFDHFAYTAAGPLVSTPLAEYTADKGRARQHRPRSAARSRRRGPRRRQGLSAADGPGLRHRNRQRHRRRHDPRLTLVIMRLGRYEAQAKSPSLDQHGELITTVPRNGTSEISRFKAYGTRRSS